MFAPIDVTAERSTTSKVMTKATFAARTVPAALRASCPYVSISQKLTEFTMVMSTSIEVSHKIVRGFHVFEADDMPGLYISHRDPRSAYEAVAPAIEKLIELDTGLMCTAVPDVPFKDFISETRAALTNAAERQKFNIFKQAA